MENNTQFLMEKVKDDPLFCVVETNMKKAFSYLDREPINNATYFESMKARHKAFLWPLNNKGHVKNSPGAAKAKNDKKDTFRHYRKVCHNENKGLIYKSADIFQAQANKLHKRLCLRRLRE